MPFPRRRKKPTPDAAASTEMMTVASDFAMRRQVLAWLTAGQSELDVRTSIARDFPDEDPDQLLQAAVNHFLAVGNIGDEGLKATYGWCLEAAKEVFLAAKAGGEFHAAIRAIRTIKELANEAATLYSPPPDPEQPEEES